VVRVQCWAYLWSAHGCLDDGIARLSVQDAANTMTVTVEPTPTMRAGSEGGWFTGGRMPAAKSIGWAIYVAGFAIWLFGYLSAGHAPAFHWDVATPWWISNFVPNR
jgi:hypothetical protein